MTTSTEDRPSLMEQIGTAANASRLVMNDKGEQDLDKIAALGFAGIEMSRPRAYGGARWELPDAELVRAELSVMLWRAKAARDDMARRHAIVYFAELLTLWGEFSSYSEAQVVGVLRPFAGRIIHEWIEDKCPGCCGTGMQEAVGKGKKGRRRPTLYGRGLKRVICAACGGTQRARIDEKARAANLGLTMPDYDAGRWSRLHARGKRTLRDIVDRLRTPLHSAKSKRMVAT